MNSRIRSSIHSTFFCLILLGPLALCSTLLAQRLPSRPTPPPIQPQRPAVVKIRVEADKVTADITDCPLQKALEELANRTGIIFEVRGQDNPLVSVHLQRVSLQEAIQRIASSHNTIFFYGRNQQEPERITMVRVLPRTNPIQQPSIVYLGTGTVTKSNEEIETPEQALAALEGSTDQEERQKAIEVLVNTRSNAAINALMSFMFDPEPEIRAMIIEGLADLRAHSALPGVLRSLKDTNPEVRKSAAAAVASLGSAKNINDLKPLTDDKDASVAAAADQAIKRLSAAK